MNYLALSIGNPTGDGSTIINPPAGVPTGGLPVGESALQTGITILLVGISIFAVFFFLWGGITWITSGGDKTKVQNARNKMIYSIIGLIVAFMAFFIVTVIGKLFGVDLLNAK